MEIEGSLRDAGGVADLVDGGVVEAIGQKEPVGRLADLAAGALAACGAGLEIGARGAGFGLSGHLRLNPCQFPNNKTKSARDRLDRMIRKGINEL